MNDHGWFQRLRTQCPGWFFWTSSDRPRWWAVPAPDGTTLAEARMLPNGIGADTPTELRAAVRLRYGFYDECSSCLRPARECGHRQPERDTSRP